MRQSALQQDRASGRIIFARNSESSEEDGRDEVVEEEKRVDVLARKLYLTTNLITSRPHTLADIHLLTYTLEGMREEVDAFRSIPSLEKETSSIFDPRSRVPSAAPPGQRLSCLEVDQVRRLSAMAASLLQGDGRSTSSTSLFGRVQVDSFLETSARKIRGDHHSSSLPLTSISDVSGHLSIPRRAVKAR